MAGLNVYDWFHDLHNNKVLPIAMRWKLKSNYCMLSKLRGSAFSVGLQFENAFDSIK